MDIKRRLIRRLPDWAKRGLAVPYDRLQTVRADRTFRGKVLAEREPAADAPDHLLVIVVDALRGDAVGRELTPFLAGLSGTVEAVAPSPWTFPSVTSLVTGQFPHEHGTLRPAEPDDSPGLTLPPKLSDEVETLTEVLAGAGYRTYGGFGHDTPFVALSGRFHDHDLAHTVTASAEDVLTKYKRWFTRHRAGRSFGYVHLADPHQPLDPPSAYVQRHDVDLSIDGLQTWRFGDTAATSAEAAHYREHRRRLYRATIDYVDDQIAALVNRLPSEVTLIVTSDHGEAHWEQAALDLDRFDGTGVVDHGGTPYEAVARVPLLVDDWDLEFGDYVSLVDVAPTILDAVGLSGALCSSGYSLFEGVETDRIPVIEGTMSGSEKKAVYHGPWKLVASEDVQVWFELPAEVEATPSAPLKKTLRDALPAWDSSGPGTEVSGVVEDRLADLGYR